MKPLQIWMKTKGVINQSVGRFYPGLSLASSITHDPKVPEIRACGLALLTGLVIKRPQA
jgi:hypothetical protein